MVQPDSLNVGRKRKADGDGVADASNHLWRELVLKCNKSEGVRDFYHTGVLGYGAQSESALGGALGGRELAPMSETVDTSVRFEERTRKTDRFWRPPWHPRDA